MKAKSINKWRKSLIVGSYVYHAVKSAAFFKVLDINGEDIKIVQIDCLGDRENEGKLIFDVKRKDVFPDYLKANWKNPIKHLRECFNW